MNQRPDNIEIYGSRAQRQAKQRYGRNVRIGQITIIVTMVAL
jgi:hypothetical protein